MINIGKNKKIANLLIPIKVFLRRILPSIYSKTIKNIFYTFYKNFGISRTFAFQNRKLNYFYHCYNNTWENERCVEIPIIKYFLKKNKKEKILEIGNVLSHYFETNHLIIDKYEKAIGVINEDILNFQSLEKYDLIISISTLEHIGWDEKPRQPEKIFLVIPKLKNLLKPNGKIIITIPIGWNLYLDELLRRKKISFNEQYNLERISIGNKWIQVNWNKIKNLKFGIPFCAANGLIIGIIKK